MNNANALGIQTYETDVVCGMWCQGGSVKFYPTNHPQYTDIADVWVKGSDALDLVKRLRAELAECQLISARQFLDYGWHKDGCTFREDCDPCDCGFETLLRAALTANKQARKGGGGGVMDIVKRLKQEPPSYTMDFDAADEIDRLRAELAACKQDAKHRITRLRDALANLHGNCYVADAPTEMIAAEEALAAEALDAARNGEGE